MTRATIRLLLVTALCLCACSERAATRADCQLILDRVITIELGELGYHDLALTHRKQQELRSRLRTRLDACVGRPIAPDANVCIASAQTTEELSHRCLH